MDTRRIEHIHKEASEERRTLRGGDGLSSHFAGLCLELLEHVAKQDAQASQSKVTMAPHTFAQMVNRVRDLAFDFGTCEQFRDRVSELLGEYILVGHNSKGAPEPTDASVVAVPPLPKLTGSRADAAVWGIPQDIEDVCFQAGNPVLAAYQAGIRRGHAIAENDARALLAELAKPQEPTP